MKNLLVVDDEKNFLLSLLDMLSPFRDQYTVFSAFNGIEAIEILNKEKIDLVITDLKMPEMDGFGLLAHMTASSPDIPVIVMTAFATPENTNRLDTLGLFPFIEKPIEFKSLHEKIKQTLERKTQGHVTGVSLASFLQLVGLDNKTCTLRITSNDLVGVFYFKDGELLDAIHDKLSGEEAAIEISGWHPAEIDIEESCRKSEKVIESPLGFLLIEGARRKDEKAEAITQEKNPEIELPMEAESDSQEENNIFIDLAEPEDDQPGLPGIDIEIQNSQPRDEEQAAMDPALSERLERIQTALQTTIGPVGDSIMGDTVESWKKAGESNSRRLNELTEALCMEIGDSSLETSFRSAVAPILEEAGITLPNSVPPSPTHADQQAIPAIEQEVSDLFPDIQKAFTSTVGPKGEMLMKEFIEKWGQQGPSSLVRIDELIDLLCTEIEDQDLEHFFRLKIVKLL